MREDFLADVRRVEAEKKGCKWCCGRKGGWRIDCVFWGPGKINIRSYTQEMKSQVRYCPICGDDLQKRRDDHA